MDIDTAAAIITGDWLNIRRNEVFYYITDKKNLAEAQACIQFAEQRGAVTKLAVLPENSIQNGILLEDMKKVMSYADVIVGATTYSFITTDAVDFALKHGARFLSLPMDTNNGRSLFESDFLGMDTRRTERNAKRLIRYLRHASRIRAETSAGTSVVFSKEGRRPGYFNGIASKRGSIGSSSFEVYVPVVEDSAEGTVVVDGSLGYLGRITEPVHLTFHNGRITQIEHTADGSRLSAYIESFHDPEMRAAAEFGIGLNELSKCIGRSYIEDESSAGTFHIGLGRNLALGGKHDAAGHFDIVMQKPDIYADSVKILTKGCISV